MGKKKTSSKKKPPRKVRASKVPVPIGHSEIMELPPDLMKWMSDPTAELDEKVRQALDKILENERMRSSLWLLAIIRKRIRRLISVFEELDTVSASIKEDLVKKQIDPEDKVALLKALQDEADKISKFIQNVSSREMLSVIMSSIETEAAGTKRIQQAEIKLPSSFMQLTPEKRERVRQTLVDLMQDKEGTK